MQRLSEEQQHAVRLVLDALERPPGAVLLEAVAGSGKSATLLAMTEEVAALEAGYRTLLLAYNVEMARTLRERLPATAVHVDVHTLHAYGLRVLRAHRHHEVRVDVHKLYRTATHVLGRPLGTQEWRNLRTAVDRLRHRGVGLPPTTPHPRTLPETVLEAMLADDGVVDAEDQIYQCIQPQRLRGQCGAYDLVLVDEAQDMNPSSILFLRHCVLGPRTVICFVGDACQAIYQFRGACANSLLSLQTEFVPRSVGLTVCFRCPRRIASLAAHINPAMRAAPGAPLGTVTLMRRPPLVRDYLRLVDAHGPLIVLHRANRGVLGLLEDLFRLGPHRTTPQWISPMAHAQLGELLLLSGGGATLGELHAHAQNAPSTTSTTTTNGHGGGTVPTDGAVLGILDAAVRIDGGDTEWEASPWLAFVRAALNGPSTHGEDAALIVSTVHATKGQEYSNVMVAEFDRFGDYRDGDVSQERNLLYIALTRARQRLTLVHSGRGPGGGSPLLPEEIIYQCQTLAG